VLKFEGLAQTGFGIASREIPRGAVWWRDGPKVWTGLWIRSAWTSEEWESSVL